jgi:hypothetical protein
MRGTPSQRHSAKVTNEAGWFTYHCGCVKTFSDPHADTASMRWNLHAMRMIQDAPIL